MHRIFIFISIYSLFYNLTIGQIKSRDTLKIIVANGSDIVYDESCQNSIFYDKETGAICKNGHYSILYKDKAGSYRPKPKYLIYGDIINGKRYGWWNYEYPPDSNNNIIHKFEVYNNGLLLDYSVDLFYKEADSIIKVLYRAKFKNGTGYVQEITSRLHCHNYIVQNTFLKFCILINFRWFEII